MNNKKKKKLFYSNIFTPESINYYQDNILDFVNDIIFNNSDEYFLSDQQKELLLSIQNNKRIAAKSGKGIGKCQVAGTDILLADGRYEKIEILNGRFFGVLSLDDKGNAVEKLAKCFYNGVKDCVKVKTEYGKELLRTKNHPLLTLKGWKPISELKTGDYIAIPKTIPSKTCRSIGEHKAKLLGYVIGDGGITGSSINFTQQEGPQLEEFREIVKEFGCEVIKANKGDKYTYRVRNIIQNDNGNLENKACAYLRELNMMGKNAFEKRVPNVIFEAPLNEISLFLSRLYACDGWAYSKSKEVSKAKKDIIQIGYCTVSKTLATDIQRLLHRFGIVAKVRYKKTSYTYKGNQFKSGVYCIDLNDKDSIIKFVEKIGIYGKEEAVNKVRELTLKRIYNGKKDLSKYDYFPHETFDILSKYVTNKDYRYTYNLKPSNQDRIGRKVLEKIVKDKKIKELEFFTNADIGWDRIESIEDIGYQETYGITVQDTHNYINDVCEHNTGGLSFAVLWFMCCFSHPKVIVTAPTFATIKSAIWPEIALWLSRSLVRDIFEHTAESLYLIEEPKTYICHPRTSRSKEDMQGLHAENMMIVVDEASGLKSEIFEALDTTLTGKNNKIVMIGNPTQVTGSFYDAFNKFKSRWTNHTFSALNSPFVKQEQIDYYIEKYGKLHDLYLVNILGEFPSGSPDSFLSLSDVNACLLRYDEVQPNGDIEIGIDVARKGDDLTVLYWRQGYKVYPAKTMAKNSIPEAVDLVLNTVDEIRKKTGYDKKIRVKVDDTGVGGGVTDYLKLDRSHNIEVIACNNGGSGNEKYQNEASLNWGHFKDLINLIALPDHEYVDGVAKPSTTLVEELVAREWKLSPSGKIMLEPKADCKKRLKSSPDRADALVLCFAQKTPEETVLKKLDVLDPQTVKVLHYAGEERYGAVYYGKDMTVSVAYTAWDGRRLYIYDEFLSGDSVVNVAMNILQHQGVNKIIGNDRIFGKNADGLDTKYSKYGVRLTENYNYDEMSGIDALMTLTLQKRLIINPGCVKTIEQLSGWKIDNKRVEQEREYGLCYALTLITSFLKRKITHTELPVVVSSYVDKRGVTGFKSVKDEKSWLLM